MTVEDAHDVDAPPGRSWCPGRSSRTRPTRCYESTCHEGNYGMVGMLANTRAAERLFKQGKGKDPRTMDIATGATRAADRARTKTEKVKLKKLKVESKLTS